MGASIPVRLSRAHNCARLELLKEYGDLAGLLRHVEVVLDGSMLLLGLQAKGKSNLCAMVNHEAPIYRVWHHHLHFKAGVELVPRCGPTELEMSLEEGLATIELPPAHLMQWPRLKEADLYDKPTEATMCVRERMQSCASSGLEPKEAARLLRQAPWQGFLEHVSPRAWGVAMGEFFPGSVPSRTAASS